MSKDELTEGQSKIGPAAKLDAKQAAKVEPGLFPAAFAKKGRAMQAAKKPR